MMVYETNGGDIVAIELDGETAIVSVGRVLGRKGTKRGSFEPSGVIVNRMDPETHRPMAFDDRGEYPMGLVPPNVEVELVASIDWLRRLRYLGPVRTRIAAGAHTDDGGREIDPMARMHERAHNGSLLERGIDADDIPY